MKKTWLKRQREIQGVQKLLLFFIYIPQDSRLRFLAPKHTSRLLFWSEVLHSTKRLGDRSEALWGQGTVHPYAKHLNYFSQLNYLYLG